MNIIITDITLCIFQHNKNYVKKDINSAYVLTALSNHRILFKVFMCFLSFKIYTS
jgi:hypothetical protein